MRTDAVVMMDALGFKGSVDAPNVVLEKMRRMRMRAEGQFEMAEFEDPLGYADITVLSDKISSSTCSFSSSQ